MSKIQFIVTRPVSYETLTVFLNGVYGACTENLQWKYGTLEWYCRSHKNVRSSHCCDI